MTKHIESKRLDQGTALAMGTLERDYPPRFIQRDFFTLHENQIVIES